jgi:hypothetical protein
MLSSIQHQATTSDFQLVVWDLFQKDLTECLEATIIHISYETIGCRKADDCCNAPGDMLLWRVWTGRTVRQDTCPHGKESMHVWQAGTRRRSVLRSDAVAEQELCKRFQALQQSVRVLYQARQMSRAHPGGFSFQSSAQELHLFLRVCFRPLSAPAKRAAGRRGLVSFVGIAGAVLILRPSSN